MSFSRIFYAAYTGECSECGCVIDIGDPVGYVDDCLVCEACYNWFRENEGEDDDS
jgi:hypothetical protein